MVKKSKDFFSEEFFWKEVMPQLTKAVFGGDLAVMLAWIGMSKADKRLQSLNSIITMAEVIPNVDIGLPSGVVLGAMYDKQDEAMAMITQIMTLAKEVPDVIAEEAEKLREVIIGEKLQQACEGVGGTWANGTCTIPKDKQQTIWPPEYEEDQSKKDRLNNAIEDCVKKAKKDLGVWAYTLIPLSAYVFSCLGQKGFDVTIDMVREHSIITGALI